jgi:hypothetical protein
MNKTLSGITIFLTNIFLISSCVVDHTAPVRNIPITVVNASGSVVTNINLLFAGQTIQSLGAGKEHIVYITWSEQGDYTSNDHIEYTINGNRYNARNESGDFVGRPINAEGGLRITIYASYYTLKKAG